MPDSTAYTIDDLGVQMYDDTWLNLRPGTDPADGSDVAIMSLARGGFVVAWPGSGRSRQVRLPQTAEGWGVAQAPDGSIWQCLYGGQGHTAGLHRWNWQGDVSERRVDLPNKGYFTIDVDPAGRVYAPEYTVGVVHMYDPATDALTTITGLTDFGRHTRNVCCAADGWVYVTVTDFTRSFIVAIAPETQALSVLGAADSGPLSWQYGQILRTGDGRVLACSQRWGRACWSECIAGQIVAIGEDAARLAQTRIAVTHSTTGAAANTTALAYADGSYVAELGASHMIMAGGDAGHRRIELERAGSPVRIFSVTSGGGRVWGGTFIPLTLLSYDPATDETRSWGNPTQTTGEIYNARWAGGALYMGSYTRAMLTRLSPDQPLSDEPGPCANPMPLGTMKPDGLPLQRPHGVAGGDADPLSPGGVVYFAAHGGYGCVDSGICRIDPATGEIRRWLYPDTDFGALCLLPSDRLLVGERRAGEDAIRFTCIDATDGRELWSEPMIEDAAGITSWLIDRERPGRVYGVHPYRACIFSFDYERREIVERLPEIDKGALCYNMLIDGPDGRIWGLSVDCVFAVDRDLTAAAVVAPYPDHAGLNAYRFGLTVGPDGHLYFPNGPHLMRLRTTSE